MSNQIPPTISLAAAKRWSMMQPGTSPWLHEEVGTRMAERLAFLKLSPKQWVHWEPLRGGVNAHQLVAGRYPRAKCYAIQAEARLIALAEKALKLRWWNPARWKAPSMGFVEPQEPVQMLWANMSLHMSADPQALLTRWHQLLEPNGFLMFSCFGPDTLRQLRQIYAREGWPPPAHAFTDMHDWGDMLLHAGFSDPVMDMERITLTFNSPERMLLELRELGRNLHAGRFSGLRGRQWRQRLLQSLQKDVQGGAHEEAFQLDFEIVYGHAVKGIARMPVGPQSTISLKEMRGVLGMNREKEQQR
jgi:malonyl-CoA O-methyltransferase